MCFVSYELLREGVPDLAAAHAVPHGVCYNVVAVLWSPNSLNSLHDIHCADAEEKPALAEPPKQTPPGGSCHLHSQVSRQ